MKNQLMILTATLREFDGYDRWEKTPYQAFGTAEELQELKEKLESPLFSNRKYVNIEIREATGSEMGLYQKELENDLTAYENEYNALLLKAQALPPLMQEKREKLNALEKLKISY